jgi:hypothetical protein
MVKLWITDDDIEAQLQDDFTHGATRACAPEPQRMDPKGVLRWGFDKATSHLRCRQKLWRLLHRAMVDVPRRRRKPG